MTYDYVDGFYARRAERGIATADHPSVRLSVCLWRWGIVVT